MRATRLVRSNQTCVHLPLSLWCGSAAHTIRLPIKTMTRGVLRMVTSLSELTRSENAQSFVVIGDTVSARQVCATLSARGHCVEHLLRPDDSALRSVCGDNVSGIAILVHDDVLALRYALAAAHINETVPIITSVFDRTLGAQLESLLPQCTAISPADLAAASLAGPCANPGWLAARARHQSARATTYSETGLPIEITAQIERRSIRRGIADAMSGLLHPHDTGTRILLSGFFGLNAVLVLDWLWLTLAGHPALASLHEAVRVVTTVGPAVTSGAATGYLMFGCFAMLTTMVLTAMFTAGIVDRLLSPRLSSLAGRRRLPRSGHVLVVGLGQVGLRLCRELLALGVPVIAIEQNPDAPNLRLVQQLKIPAVVGHGEDRALLERLGVHRARALAAVGSDELGNIAVIVAAQGVSSNLRVIVRAGEQEAIAETRSLLPLGIVRDVNSISAAYVTARLLSLRVDLVIADTATVYVRDAENFTAMPVEPSCRCTNKATMVSAA